jgi:hypothetical protein
MPEALLTQQQLAAELQVTVRTPERSRQEGTGPAFIRVGRSPAAGAPTSRPGCSGSDAARPGSHG